jgi:nitrile hydratase beta subunit
MQSFGPVPMDQRVFHADWEARVMAITIALLARGVVQGEQARYARERMRPVDYYQASYYERYLVLLEDALARLDNASRSAAPSGSAPPAGGSILGALAGGAFTTQRDVAAGPRFVRGQTVRVRNINPVSHTRLPRYVRGKRGTIEQIYPAYVFPDSNALGQGEQPQHVYTVSFAAGELWGDAAEPNASMRVDIWESHMEAA